MKTIGLYLGAVPGGGEFQYQLTLLDALADLPRQEYRVVAGQTSPLWTPHVRDSGLEPVPLPLGLWSKALGEMTARAGLPAALQRAIHARFSPTARAMARLGCDLWLFPYPTARSFQLPVPALVSIHDLMHRYERGFPESSGGREYADRERNLAGICARARGLVVESAVGRDQLRECYGPDPGRIHVLPYIAPRYMDNPHVPAGFDERHRLPQRYLFYPARFWEHKNHRRLLDAVALLRPELPDLRLVLAGGRQNASAAVAEQVRRLGLEREVLFLGQVPDGDMPELYRRARALVMPTCYGPTNIPPLEAFVAGCPVAVSRIYGIPEQVGDAALLFDPSSTEEIAACIRRLWTDDRLCAELAAAGRRRAGLWGREQFNARFREILDTVLTAGEAP